MAAPADEQVLPAGVATVLAVLRSSAVVVDDSDDVVKSSAPAVALGLVRSQRLASAELAELVSQVRRDGRRGGPPQGGGPARTVTARSRPELAAGAGPRRGPHPRRRVDAVRRDYVANVSHELKTPVRAIRLLAEAVGTPPTTRRRSSASPAGC
jgi:two-component system sensor histidine kinase SenX3